MGKKKVVILIKKTKLAVLLPVLILYSILVCLFVYRRNRRLDHDLERDLLLGVLSIPSCVQNKEICSPDEVGKYLESTRWNSVVHEPKKSIPQSRRIPFAMANNDTHIIQQRHLLPANGTATALVEYNPSILPLYRTLPNGTLVSDLDSKLLNYLTGKYHPDFTQKDVDRVKYISVERSTNHHACGSVGTRRRSDVTAEQCFFAFALLDEHLQLIPAAETVVDFDYYYISKFVGKTRPEGTYLCNLNDVTIFPAKTTTDNPKQDQLFLMSGSGDIGTLLIPIDIRRTPHFVNDQDGWDTKLVGQPFPADMFHDGTMYGSGLQLRIAENGKRNAVKYSNHRFIRRHGGYVDGRKNYHVFEANDGTSWLELRPFLPHIVTKIHLHFEKGIDSLQGFDLIPNSTLRRGYERFYFDNASIYDEYSDLKETFETVKLDSSEVQSGGLKYRGTACCIDLNLKMKVEGDGGEVEGDGGIEQQVKVGIGHTVTKDRQYLSFFYAFLPYPPFTTIRLSGYFCLGGMKQSDVGHSAHWISKRDGVFDESIALKGETYKCPKVTFASGLSEMVGNFGNVIISYGVNDCYSRSIIVSKEKIKMLLSA